jgi:hypothetical protein
MRRRGVPVPAPAPTHADPGHDDYDHDDLSLDDSKNRPKRPSLPARNQQLLCRVANAFLICSVILWLVVMILSITGTLGSVALDHWIHSDRGRILRSFGMCWLASVGIRN